MDWSAGASWIVIPIQIFCLDLLLGADNAMAIALVCRTLHPADRRNGLLLGAGGAVLLRLLMTIGASALLSAPYVKMIGALALAAIAINVIRRDRPGAAAALGAGAASPARRSLLSAASIIVVADAAMSIDNVIALAAIARGNFWLLAAGVLLSIPLLAFGSAIFAALSRHFPALIALGCGLLGWIAGGMAISDPAIADWAAVQAPALVLIAPALGAIFVLGEAWFVAGERVGSLESAGVEAARAARDLAGMLDPRPEGRGAALARSDPAVRTRSGPAPAAPAPAKAAVARPARKRATREDRIMLVGLVILFLMAAAMIGFVMYMVQSYAVERFS
jgi:YjbE family integral membrane protein